MAAAIMDAIIEANLVGGQEESFINPTEAVQALIGVIGMMVEADPTISTPKDIREFSEGVGKQVQHQIKTMRAHFKATGERAWKGHVVRLQ